MDTSYKTIAVQVDDSPHNAARVKLAARLAVRFDAHLIGVAATGMPASLYLGGLSGEAAAAVATYRDLLTDCAIKSLAAFEISAAKEGVLSLEKRIIEKEAGAALCLQGRYSDLVIAGQGNPDEQAIGQPPTPAEYAVLHSAHPVLIIPYVGEYAVMDKPALIAWNGSMEAARAIYSAIPLLRQASRVQIVIFDVDDDLVIHGEEPGADIALYLARHDIKVDVANHETADGDIGHALVAHASRIDAGFVVMGAYGHSRFREIVLGGATRTVLRSMGIPVLMSH